MTERRTGNYVFSELEQDRLGDGGFAVVYRGRNSQDENEEVAVKYIDLKKSKVRQLPAEILEREITILQNLASTPHQNLVRLLSFEKDEGKAIYIGMEYCRGGDLRTYLKEKGTLRESVIRQFFLQIGTGMKFLHDKGIIHRDLKPENILLDFDGPRYPAPKDIVLKIGDFGLGRYIPTDAHELTVCGTLNYMAPEIATGVYDQKVDTWSTGVMMYECLVGTSKAGRLKNFDPPPSASQNIKDLLKALLVEQPKKRLDFGQFLAHKFFRDSTQDNAEGAMAGPQRTSRNTSAANSEGKSLFGKFMDSFAQWSKGNKSEYEDIPTHEVLTFEDLPAHLVYSDRLFA